MRNLIQFIIVAALTGAGAVFGRCVVISCVPPLIPHLARFLSHPGPPKHDMGDLIGIFLTMGYNLGLLTGIGMTLAILGGLRAGLVLARRVPKHAATAARAV